SHGFRKARAGWSSYVVRLIGRIMTGQNGRVRVCPEHAVIAVVFLDKPDAPGIEAAHQARIDGDALGVVGPGLSGVGGASACAAMMKLKFAIAPHVDERIGLFCEVNVALRIV